MDARQIEFLIKRMDSRLDKSDRDIKRHISETVGPIARLAENNLKRIETLERWQSKIMGMAFVAGFVGSVAIKMITKT